MTTELIKLSPDPVVALTLTRRSVAEAIGTAFLLIGVVGSGILADRLTSGNTGITLLANSLATGATLLALIEWLSPISGAHLNPVITLALAFRGDISRRTVAAYVPAQIVGAVLGVIVAHAMFEAPLIETSTRFRGGASNLLGEFVATFGLVGIVWTCSLKRPGALAATVAAYITGAFWFTPTDFANPAVTLARVLTDTFAGIRPADVPGFIAAEIAGAAAAATLFRWLLK